MPQFELNTGESSESYDSCDEFTQGFIEALLFTAPTGDSGDSEDSGEDLTGAGVNELAPEALAAIKRDCAKFQTDNAALLAAVDGAAYSGSAKYGDYDLRRAGNDFLFTRNRHGCGFWDRANRDTAPEAEAAFETLTEAAHGFPDGFDLYRGDDGRLYVFG